MHLVPLRSQSLVSRRSIFLGLLPLAALLGSSLAFSNVSAQIQIDGRCNIFGAGHSTPPAPAGGGAGLLPVEIPLPSDAAYVRLTVSGSVSCCGTSVSPNGPDGGSDRDFGSDILSFGGISGVRDAERYEFLTGVFIDATEPFGDAPARLDFSASGLTDAFTELSPEMRQTFFVGDGLTPSGEQQIFHVPPGATRLVLGVADAFAFLGDPGYFDDNGGAFTVESIEIVPNAPPNHDPDLSAATASPALLWSPNHELEPVSITGVTDPDGDPVTIAVTGVTQDEPVDEDHCPDAVVSSAGDVSLRAERAGGGNGRVYVISFTASDGRGGSSAGSVQVCVPHDADQLVCVDDGQQFDAQAFCKKHNDDQSLLSRAASTGVTLATTPPAGAFLEYSLPVASDVRIGVYDIAGRQVATLLHERQAAGAHRLDWAPAGLERGVYFCRVQAGSVTLTKSVLVMKR